MNWKKASDDGKEYDENGKEMEGGGYYKGKGRLQKMSKAENLTADDLEKSLEVLQNAVATDDVPTRKNELLSKAAEGDLSKGEQDELFQILGGGQVDDPSGEVVDLNKGFSENDQIREALDVSEYLQALHGELNKSLATVGGEIEKADNRRHEQFLMLAKAVVDIGHMIQAVSENLGVIAGQPARAPKSRGVQVLQKGFGGQPPAGGDQMSKSDLADTIDVMFRKSMDDGRDGMSQCGEDLLKASSKLESTGDISPRLLKEVVTFRGNMH